LIRAAELFRSKDGNEAWSHQRFCPLLQQSRRAHFQRLRQLLDDRDGRIPSGAFDIADVGAMDARTIRELLLAPTLLVTKTLEVRPEAFANVHATAKTPLSMINLQTISDI
jgi:hypothetical protein